MILINYSSHENKKKEEEEFHMSFQQLRDSEKNVEIQKEKSLTILVIRPSIQFKPEKANAEAVFAGFITQF